MASTATVRKAARKPKAARNANVGRKTNVARKTKVARETKVARKTNPARKAKPTANRPAKKPQARQVPRRVKPAARRALAAGRRAKQHFTVSHHHEADFKAAGLRAYALYRDLGIAAATAGLCQAHVIRFLGPCTDEVRKRHYHETELQLVYVLKGWVKNEFDGHGEQLMQAGSCWLQPPGIEHAVLDYSDDCEVLEIIVPADFTTVELAP